MGHGVAAGADGIGPAGPTGRAATGAARLAVQQAGQRRDDGPRLGLSAGVSIAIIDGFEVVYVRGFGFAEPGRPVEADTLFQAASLTKPVSAVVAAAAAEAGLVDLEADVAGMLTSW